MNPRAVVVVHRHALVAEGLAAALGCFPQVTPLGVATNFADADSLGGRAHAVALDDGLPEAHPLADRLRRKGVRVVLISDDASGDGDGARVSTHASVAQLAAALVPGVAGSGSGARRLSPRETEVLELVGRGFSGKQVARHLGISPKTVEHHKTRIYSKLDVPNQAAAVRAFGAGERWTPSFT